MVLPINLLANGGAEVQRTFTWSIVLLLVGSLFLSRTTLNAQGYGSFVDPPRSPQARFTNSQTFRGKAGFPAAMLATYRKLSALRSHHLARELSFSDLETRLESLGIATVLDSPSLEDEGIADEDIIEFPAPSMSLERSLTYGLRKLACDWTIDHAGNLVIGSTYRMEEKLVAVTYDVTTHVEGGDVDRLVDVITNTIAPDSWDDVGGPGTIQPYRLRSRQLLVVSSPLRVQMKTQRLLQSLHSLSESTSTVLPTSVPPRLPERESLDNSRQLVGSSVIAMPHEVDKRGIRLPNANGDGTTSSYGGGMMGGLGGGMF